MADQRSPDCLQRVRKSLREDFRLTIVSLLAAFAAIWILPFSIYRFATGNWLAGTMDLLIVLGVTLPTGYALLSGRSEWPIRILAVVVCGGCVAAAMVLGLAGLMWSYACVAVLFFVLAPRSALALGLLTLGANVLLAENALRSDFERFSYLASAALVGLYAFVVASRNASQRRRLERMAWLDPLTGVGNRRLLELELADAASKGAGAGTPPGLALLDLDHFKRVNDQFGHEAGDQALVQFAELVRQSLRKVDRFYRFGGEEFVLLAPALDAEGLHALAEKIRSTTASGLIGPGGPITVSIGATLLQPGEHWTSWLGRADAALYRAKHGGRNLAVVDLDAATAAPLPDLQAAQERRRH